MTRIDFREPSTVPPSKRPKRRPARPRQSELVGSPQVLLHDAAYRHLCERASRQARREKLTLLAVVLGYIVICAVAGAVVDARGGLAWML